MHPCGVFSSSLKLSYIITVFKIGKRDDIRNYRHISKVTPTPKIFDCFFTSKLNKFAIEKIHFIQFGFMPNKSTLSS